MVKNCVEVNASLSQGFVACRPYNRKDFEVQCALQAAVPSKCLAAIEVMVNTMAMHVLCSRNV
jgi:hypothetical protein